VENVTAVSCVPHSPSRHKVKECAQLMQNLLPMQIMVWYFKWQGTILYAILFKWEVSQLGFM